MDEPIKKKAKIDESDRVEENGILEDNIRLQQLNIEQELGKFHELILTNCLCGLSESELQKLYDVLWSGVTSKLSRDETILLITSIQLICEISIKQNAKGFICPGFNNICHTFARHEDDLTRYFLKLSIDSDRYVTFATSRAVSSFLLIVKTHNDQREESHQRSLNEEDDDQILLNWMTDSLAKCSSPEKVSFSLDVLKRIIEWKDFDEHTLEDSTDDVPQENCRALTVVETETVDFMHVKCLCINSLKSRWSDIVNNFNNLIAVNSPSRYSNIITFLNLRETIISVKANLSVIDTKPFYSYLDCYIELLSENTPPVIWKHILSLLSEVLCYGSTLALQDSPADEPAELAAHIIRNLRDSRNQHLNILNVVPYRRGSSRFGGGRNNEGDKVLLQRLVLLILKVVAVAAKEACCNSSSDSSAGSEIEQVDIDMKLIERSIAEVLDQLDNCVKGLLFYHPNTPMAQWIVHIFADQDDYLIESMVCCLDVAVGLCYRENSLPALREKLNPTITFLQFLKTVSCNANVLLDFLTSNETCFLLYILRYLKYVCRNWREFIQSCDREISEVIGVLNRLKQSIDRLCSKNLFPYNIRPVLRLLQKIDSRISGT